MVNEAMISSSGVKALRSGHKIKTQNGVYTITGMGSQTNATKDFEATNEKGKKFNLRVSLRGARGIQVAAAPSLNFPEKEEMLESVNEHHDDKDFPGKDLTAWDLLDKMKASNPELYNKVEDYMKGMAEGRGSYTNESNLKGILSGKAAKNIAKALSVYVKGIIQQPNNNYTYLQLFRKADSSNVIKTLNGVFGLESTDGGMFKADMGNGVIGSYATVKFSNNTLLELKNKLTEAPYNLEIHKLLVIMNKTKAGSEYKKALMALIAMAEKKSGKTIRTKEEALSALNYTTPETFKRK